MIELTDGELAAALADAKPAEDVLLPRLRREASDRAPAGSADGIGILAAPTRAITLTLNARGALGFHPAYLAARDGRYASLRHRDTGWTLAIHDSAAKTVGALELSLADAGPAGSAELTLDLAGFAALAAAADAHHEARLRAELDRRHLPPPELSAKVLDRQLAHGLSTGDTRWGVCAARWTSPISLAGARGKMKEGLAALEGAGLEVARELAPVRHGVGASAVAWKDGHRTVVGHGMLLASERASWWVEWDGVPVAPRASLRGASPDAVAARLGAWLGA